MEIEELIDRVAREPERTITRTVWIAPPDVVARAETQGGMSLLDFVAAPGRRAEQRSLRYRHILGPPASEHEIDAWQTQHPRHPLPRDVRQLLMRVDGIHLWANAETGRAYVGLAPLKDWELARVIVCGPAADPYDLDDRYVALTYHDDAAAFVVLDVDSGTYYLMDTCGPDTTSPIGRSVGELLDWLWRTRIEPRP
jgi:hypothetical protein